MAKAKVLLVGGAGYIGSHMNKILHDLGYDTVVFDNFCLSRPQPEQLGELVRGDTAIPSELEALFSAHSFDAVMHFGAYINARESVEQPSMYYDNNVTGTLNLLNAMLKAGVDKLIFSSTAAVYGDAQSELISETHPTLPVSPYGRSKLIVEGALADYERAYGLRSCIFRYFNAAGGDPDGKVKNCQTAATNLIPIVLRSLQEKTVVTVNGNNYPTPDGTCVRDFIHVCDIAQAHLMGMERLLGGGRSLTCNLGTGHGFSVQQVIDTASRVTGQIVSTQMGPPIQGDMPMIIADATKANRELGWKAQYTGLDEMIAHAWQALHSQPRKVV